MNRETRQRNVHGRICLFISTNAQQSVGHWLSNACGAGKHSIRKGESVRAGPIKIVDFIGEHQSPHRCGLVSHYQIIVLKLPKSTDATEKAARGLGAASEHAENRVHNCTFECVILVPAPNVVNQISQHHAGYPKKQNDDKKAQYVPNRILSFGLRTGSWRGESSCTCRRDGGSACSSWL